MREKCEFRYPLVPWPEDAVPAVHGEHHLPMLAARASIGAKLLAEMRGDKEADAHVVQVRPRLVVGEPRQTRS